MVIFLVVVLVAAMGVGIFFGVVSYQMGKIPGMSFEEMLAYTAKGNSEAKIAVGIIQNGQMRVAVYGKDAEILPSAAYEYEIGSLTKTFTASLLCKALYEGRVSLEESVGDYISLPEKEYYPTFMRLVTHTSGYKEQYFCGQMALNFFGGQQNDFYAIPAQVLQEQMGKVSLEDKDYPFRYSNFGMAVVGDALAGLYGEAYAALMSRFIKEDLGLKNTRISDGVGNLAGYWNWKEDDAYLPAGGVISTIDDMMSYLGMHMNEELPYLALGHDKIVEVNATTRQYEKMQVRMDAAGVAWLLDEEHGIVWHNGGTTNFNSYLGFDKDRQVGVVILSNLAPGYRIPATVMGPKLLMTLQKQMDENVA